METINLLSYSKKYSNKQKLLFKIINKINDEYYNVQFEIDNLILTNIHYDIILKGRCFHPNKKYIINLKVKIFYHEIFNKALTCNTRSEFKIKFPNLYDAAIKKFKCMDEISNHMEIKNIKWTFEKCFSIALKYNTRSEFYLKNKNCYNAAYLHNWLNEICLHMNGNINWTIDLCKLEAINYKTRSEFKNNSYNAYDAARRNNWLDDICSHMNRINGLLFPRIIYAYEFEDNSVYVGLTKNFKIRHSNRHKKLNDAVTIHINKTNFKPNIKFLTNFIPAEEAQKLEQFYIDKYKSEKWIILNKIKGGSLGGGTNL